MLAWERADGDDRRVVAVNFASAPARFEPPGGPFLVQVASDRRGEGGRFEGHLGPDQACVLGPA